jgi:hypothetical protein
MTWTEFSCLRIETSGEFFWQRWTFGFHKIFLWHLTTTISFSRRTLLSKVCRLYFIGFFLGLLYHHIKETEENTNNVSEGRLSPISGSATTYLRQVLWMSGCYWCGVRRYLHHKNRPGHSRCRFRDLIRHTDSSRTGKRIATKAPGACSSQQ